MIVTANLISLRLGKNTVRSAVCQSYFMAFSTSYLGCFLSVSVMISSVLLLSASFAKSRVMITWMTRWHCCLLLLYICQYRVSCVMYFEPLSWNWSALSDRGQGSMCIKFCNVTCNVLSGRLNAPILLYLCKSNAVVVTPQSGNQVSTSLGNSGLCWTVFARTRTLRCLHKEMATYRHWSVSLWRDPDDVSHCRILSPDKTEWRLISATLCGWGRCFVADQLW